MFLQEQEKDFEKNQNKSASASIFQRFIRLGNALRRNVMDGDNKTSQKKKRLVRKSEKTVNYRVWARIYSASYDINVSKRNFKIRLHINFIVRGRKYSHIIIYKARINAERKTRDA